MAHPSRFGVHGGRYEHGRGALPGASGPVYFYAVPPPYPSGHDASLAPREFAPGSAAAAVFGSNVVASATGCIVIASTTAPASIDLQGGAAGNGSLVDARWGAGSISLDRTRWVYLGSAPFNQAAGQFVAQRVVGDDVMVNAFFTPIYTVASSTGTSVNMRTSVAGSRIPLPTTVGRIVVRISSTLGPSDAVQVVLRDDPGGAWNTTAILTDSGSSVRMVLLPQGPDATLQNVSRTVTGTPPDPEILVLGYGDRILAAR